MQRELDNILNTETKIRLIRLFVSKGKNFIVTGRGAAQSAGVTPPAAHAALKELLDLNILNRVVLGRQHIYSLNRESRVVSDILLQLFAKELSIKDEIIGYLKKRITSLGPGKGGLLSILLYGSFATKKSVRSNDVDIAVITRDEETRKEFKKRIPEEISRDFQKYFGKHLDAYVITKTDFLKKIKRNLPPVSSMIREHSVVYGKTPVELVA